MEMKLNGKKITVLGAARSGLAVSKFLNEKSAKVLLSDKSSCDDKSEELKVLNALGITIETGGHTEKIYDCDFMVLSPGIPKSLPLVQKFYDLKIPVFSEVEVAAWFFQGSIIAITGSNGKTTTTMLTGEMLRPKFPDTIVAGNIGEPFSGQVHKNPDSGKAVVEVSSFQLETIDKFKPDVAVVINLAPNHLDRYDSYDDYIRAKLRILKNMTANDAVVYNFDDKELKQRIAECPARKLSFSEFDQAADAFILEDKIMLNGEALIGLPEIRLRGNHNYKNIMAAALAADLLSAKKEDIYAAAKNFKGVEHRLEFVRKIDGVTFINDSKATTVESLEVALKSFENPVVLITGGKDKGSDFTRLNQVIIDHVKSVVLIGSSTKKMYDSWNGLVPLFSAESMQAAVQQAFHIAENGEIVLLSPACASFDMFRDYEQRGKIFKECVNEI